jgi:hypothetical protein
MKKVMEIEFDETTRAHQSTIRGREPLFHVDVILSDQDTIPDSEVREIEVEEFLLPPRGNSKDEEFDLLTHIDIDDPEEEGEGNESGEEAAADSADDAVKEVPRYLKTVPDIQKFWLKTSPSKLDYHHVLMNCFSQGMECIRVFERWGKHNDLNPYADALEEWDDKVGDSWDDPPNIMLDPKEWIQENPLFD